MSNKQPTGRDYVTVLLWTIISLTLLGYIAMWRVGII